MNSTGPPRAPSRYDSIDPDGPNVPIGTGPLAPRIPQYDGAGNMTAHPFELTGGFWSVAHVCYCLGDLNHDGLRDGEDIQKFVDCLLAGGDCSCADADQTNGVTIEDADAFVSDLLNSLTCP